MTQAVYFSVSRLSSLIRINFFRFFLAGEVKEKEAVFKAMEVDTLSTSGRGTRRSEKGHSDMPALCLPHPSSTLAG